MTLKVVLKCALAVYGEQCVTTCGTPWMHEWSVDNLDYHSEVKYNIFVHPLPGY